LFGSPCAFFLFLSFSSFSSFFCCLLLLLLLLLGAVLHIGIRQGAAGLEIGDL
jgi:hypothetical protein